MYGTVSALALVLALSGNAKAHDHHHSSTEAALAGAETGSWVAGNSAEYTAVLGDNEIDANSFAGATGAFNVGQNTSVNSAVQQSMAIAAVVNAPDSSDTTKEGSNELGLAVADGDMFIGCNDACLTALGGSNEIEGGAFKNAIGAFQVLQNRSVNSGVSQAMAVGAVVNADGHDASPFGNQVALAASSLNAGVIGNTAGGTISLPDVFETANTNTITDGSFQHATGAFNVLQNASVNSAVQQGMAIGAVVNVAH
jgi:hypothetical protein